MVVRRSDQIAYVNHDIDDAIRAGILTDDDLPRDITDILGHNHRDRVNTLVTDAIRTSREAGTVMLSPKVDSALRDLRSFMFERVYRSPIAKGEEQKAKDMLQRLFEHYITHPEALPEDFHPQLSFEGLERTVCDYIAGMTDNYAVDKFTEIFIPAGWQVRG
jgi:dGTPase